MMRLILLIIYISSVTCDENVIVTLPNGKIRGLVAKTVRYNITYYGFVGIPFAAPPLGNLRFQAPQEPENWSGILETTSNNRQCYQCTKNNRYETEDCLYLNVVTPKKPGIKPTLPVLVNIYGGSFLYGSATGIHGEQYLIENGIIVVTFNYRVGPFGFLSTNDAIIPGNAGLKDQQFALKWVQKNIHLFGGDPRKVTVMGQSAGAASVSYQMLSPGSSGLFRAAISQSASALCTWAYQRKAVDTAYGIAKLIDPSFHRNRTTRELQEFLVIADAKAIDDTAGKYHVFAPVIEVEHHGAMITEAMYEAASIGKFNRVPYLMGINSEEEIGKAGNLPAFKRRVATWDKHVENIADDSMHIYDTGTRTAVGKKIRSSYTNGLLQDDLAAAIRYMSDFMFTRGVIKFAELISAYTEVYFYQFSYHGKMGNNGASIEGAGRVAHGEDGRYLWLYYDDLSQFPESDITTLNRYVGLISNFVRTLNPTPEVTELFQNLKWPIVRPGNHQYLDINTNLTISKDPRNPPFKTWVELFDKYGKRPFITY